MGIGSAGGPKLIYHPDRMKYGQSSWPRPCFRRVWASFDSAATGTPSTAGKTFSEPSAIISGRVEGKKNVVVRVHDACWTSEVIGSLKCDCREQLHLAMRYIQDQPPGIIIYCQQEGRGIGLANKIAAYALQERGLDTVQANRALGLPDDCREYSAVRHILRELEIESIRLMTNNPRKISELEAMGIVVTGRVPCVVVGNEFNQGYLYVVARTRRQLCARSRSIPLHLASSRFISLHLASSRSSSRSHLALISLHLAPSNSPAHSRSSSPRDPQDDKGTENVSFDDAG